jgi:hypothetical protein
MKMAFLILLISFINESIYSQLPAKDWDIRFGGTKEDEMKTMKRTSDGGYILGGFSSSKATGDKSQDSQGKNDYWIIKTDSNGNKQWDKSFGGNEDDYLIALEIADDNGFLLCGYSESGVSGDKTEPSQGMEDFWIVKTDSNGNKMWDKRYGGNSHEYLTAILQTEDGNFLLGGYTSSLISGDVSQPKKGFEDYWIVRINSDGLKLWDTRFGGDQDDLLQSIVQTPDGGYILAGTSSSGVSGDKSEEAHGYSDFWIVKTDVEGVKQWDKTYGGDNIDLCSTVAATDDGGYLLAGTSSSDSGYHKSQHSRGDLDYWLLKIDSLGLKLWDKTFGGVKNGDGYSTRYDFLTTLLVTSDEGCLLAGYSTSPSSGEKSQSFWKDTSGNSSLNFWIVKTDSVGNYLWDRRLGGNKADYCYSILENPDLSFTLGGKSSSDAYGDKSQGNQGADFSVDYWVIKTTPPGEIPNIYIEQLATTSFMVSNAFEVTYTATGNFNPGNTFYAILSNNAGSFDADDTIGSVSSTTSGTITTTLPTGIFNGENYHVRVLSSDPETVCPANEQPITIGTYSNVMWDWVFGGTSNEFFRNMVATEDGGFVFGGTTDSDVSGDVSQPTKGGTDYWIIKTDSAGGKLWDARYGSEGGDFLIDIERTTDGGFILGGYSGGGISGDKTESNRGSADYWMVKIDSTGTKQWDKRFGGSDLDYLIAILQTSDGGYLLGGQSRSPAGYDKSEGPKGVYDDYWIVKTDSAGNKQWDITLGGNDHEDFYDLVSTLDGGYLLCGDSRSPVSGDVTDTTGAGSFWIVKMDGSGTKLWDRKYGGPTGSGAKFREIQPAAEGGYIMAGTAGHLVGYDISTPGFDTGYGDCWLLKIDENGNKEWDKRFGGDYSDYGISVVQTADSGYLIAGESASNISGNKTQNSRGDYDYWVVRINAEQEILWDSRFGAFDNESLEGLIKTNDGNYVLGGIGTYFADGDKTQENHGGNDFWMVKIKEAVFANALLTNTVSPLSYEAGDTMQVPFTASGTFENGNVFTAQLSDASGNFDSPVFIGEVMATQSGMINAIIPEFTPAGAGYRVRVVSSNPILAGSDNGDDISIDIGTGQMSEAAASLWKVFPNPFSSSATLSFSLPAADHITAELFDLVGTKTITVVDQHYTVGRHAATIYCEGLSHGLHLLRIKSSEEVVTIKIMIE